MFPSNHAQRTIEILQLPFSLDSLVFWPILTSMVFEIALSLIQSERKSTKMSSDKVGNEVLHVIDSVKNYSFMHLHFSLNSRRLDCENVRRSEA